MKICCIFDLIIWKLPYSLKVWKILNPPEYFFFNFPSNCACKAGLFFEFFALNNRVLYLSLLCFLTLGKRVHYRRNLTYNFKKKKLSGGESFEIFSQIAPMIQASFLTFLTFFAMYLLCIFVFVFLTI